MYYIIHLYTVTTYVTVIILHLPSIQLIINCKLFVLQTLKIRKGQLKVRKYGTIRHQCLGMVMYDLGDCSLRGNTGQFLSCKRLIGQGKQNQVLRACFLSHILICGEGCTNLKVLPTTFDFTFSVTGHVLRLQTYIGFGDCSLNNILGQFLSQKWFIGWGFYSFGFWQYC